MDASWLAKYPRAAAMLQGEDDVLEYAPDRAMPDPEAQPREGISAEYDSALDQTFWVAWTRRGAGLEERTYAYRDTRREAALHGLNRYLVAHGEEPTTLD
jgi:hypothetical protein